MIPSCHNSGNKMFNLKTAPFAHATSGAISELISTAAFVYRQMMALKTPAAFKSQVDLQ